MRIRPEWSFVDVRHAVIAIGRRVAEQVPDRATVAWWKEERGERVFLDFNQAARDTIASAWSVRGRPRATVSMPITWDTLGDVEPEDFDVRTVPACSPSTATRTPGSTRPAMQTEAALDWYAADERDRGLGDMPYPPEYPKMPGEPMQVQPSRARQPPPPTRIGNATRPVSHPRHAVIARVGVPRNGRAHYADRSTSK